jgi:hypothetical protein
MNIGSRVPHFSLLLREVGDTTTPELNLGKRPEPTKTHCHSDQRHGGIPIVWQADSPETGVTAFTAAAPNNRAWR